MIVELPVLGNAREGALPVVEYRAEEQVVLAWWCSFSVSRDR